MNVKNTVTLSDRYLRYAEQLVEDGQFPSVAKVVEAGLDELMRTEELTPEQNHTLAEMAEVIRARMDTPRDQFIPFEKENLFDTVRARLDEKYAAERKAK